MSAAVILPAASARLTTVAAVRGDLGLGPDTPATTQIERWIDQASARAASYCRRVFGREVVRERIDLCRERFTEDGGILLDRGPAFRIVTATLDGVLTMPAGFQVAEGRELFLLRDGDTVRWSGRSLAVTYEVGWLLPGEDRGEGVNASPAPDLPADIERAVIQLVGVAVSAGGRDMMVKSEQVEGVGQTDFYVMGSNATLPHPEAEATLANYRRLAFA